MTQTQQPAARWQEQRAAQGVDPARAPAGGDAAEDAPVRDPRTGTAPHRPARVRRPSSGARSTSSCSGPSARSASPSPWPSARRSCSRSPTTCSGTGRSTSCSATTSITEVMVNGPNHVYVERSGKLTHHRCEVRRRDAPPTDHRQDREPGRPPRRRSEPDGGRPSARRLPRERRRAPAVDRRAVHDHPKVLEGSRTPSRTSSASGRSRRRSRTSSTSA